MDSDNVLLLHRIRHESICYTKAIHGKKRKAAKNGSGDFFCKNFPCSRPCSDSLKTGQMYEGFPFVIGDLIGEGGFSRVFEGTFHEMNVAFKFIPISSAHKSNFKSRGCYEYLCQEKLANIILFKIRFEHSRKPKEKISSIKKGKITVYLNGLY